MEPGGNSATDHDWADALRRARAHSPFLSRALDRRPDLAELLEQGRGAEAVALAKTCARTVDDTGISLRRERLGLALALGIGDLGGAFDLAHVMDELSQLADRALDRAIGAAIMKRVPDAAPAGMVALALGKQGAHELNYSSDIDPILLFDPETLPRRPRDDPADAAQRYARELVQMLSHNTAEGYVFRVDLRLRPASEVSPLAIPVAGALSHYESSALAWERAAYIRARSAGGDIALGKGFLDAIRPFVWRSSLDFGAIDEVRNLTARIRSHHEGADAPGPGFNVKLGRGGIREIEFFAQTHQLIHGGRDPSLRLRGTRAALDALAAAGHVTTDAAQTLGVSYDRLRQIEHRLQMVDDQQTHVLPPHAEGIDTVARLDGLEDGAVLIDELTRITRTVAAHFDGLIADDPAPVAPKGSALQDRIADLNFDSGDRVPARIAAWTDGRYPALRQDAAREAFGRITMPLLQAFSAAPNPSRALNRFETFVARLSSGINLFRLLEARPALLDQFVRVLTLAGPLADQLGQTPQLFDRLIDRTALDLPGSVAEIAAAMQRTGDDYERQLDRIRTVTSEARFALGVQLIEGAHDPLAIAAALSRTAEAAMHAAVEATTAQFAEVHGTVPGGELLMLGLGRLGGGMLTHDSDLDVIYLFTGAFDAQSDGARPLGATLYFNRLAQRIGGALSLPTARGPLYEVDTRLRPQGAQGPIAVSMDSFARYQLRDAWTWEHMALTRARPITGSHGAQKQVTDIIARVLQERRDPETLRRDVIAMRGDMARHKPPRGPLDVKLARGGLIDAEFLVHFLQLRHRTAFDPDLSRAIAALVEAGHVAPALAGAEAALTRMLVAARLLAPACTRPPPAPRRALAAACHAPDYDTLMAGVTKAHEVVAQCWHDVFGTALEPPD